MAEVRKATLELFDSIYPLLQHFSVPNMDRDRWYRLLDQRLSRRHDHFGYALMEGDRAVGFLGGFFNQRGINGEEHTLCNLFCWYVLEEYRQQSLLLILAFLREPGLTITSLTPSEEASLILKQFKFQVLDSHVIILPLLRLAGSSSGFEITTDPGKIGSLLGDKDSAFFLEHKEWCNHLVVWNKMDEKDYCYVVFGRVVKKGIPFTQIYHIGNSDMFRKNLGRIQMAFFRMNRTFCAVIDRRLLPGPIPFPGFSYRLRYPRLYRSETIKPEQIDNLHTELLFLQKI
jgi:hypothetical protein